MPDTVKLNLDPDYFPLMEGYKLVYHHTSTEFDGTEIVEIEFSDVRAFRDDAQALATLTRRQMGQPSRETYKVRKSAKQVLAEGGVLRRPRVEFLMPPVPGKRWIEGAEAQEIAAVDAAVEVPAGKFLRCLRVNTRIDGGGSAIRYYAPGIGCAYEESSLGERGSRVRLVSFAVPPLRRA